MKKGYFFAASLLLVASIATAWFFFRTVSDSPFYITETISMGPVRDIISATGKLRAVDEVIIGAALSGQITEVLVDFNSNVKQGQVLARIDPRTYAAVARQYRAELASIDASIALQKIAAAKALEIHSQANREFIRVRGLAKKKHISDEVVEKYASDLAIAQLNVKQVESQERKLDAQRQRATALLQQAQIDLERTYVRSPISGVVIDRTIEEGQTVASNLEAPDLFVIARDLTHMEIEAYIDESDISRVRSDMEVIFTVDTYPNKIFSGKVRQIRKSPLDAEQTAGVVIYRVIVDTDNPDQQLFPGMTANIEFLVREKIEVPRVSNIALRIGDQLAAAQTNFIAERSWRNLACLGLNSTQVDTLEQHRRTLASSTDTRDYRISTDTGKLDAVIIPQLDAAQLDTWNQLRTGSLRCGYLYQLDQNDTPALRAVLLGTSGDDYTELLDNTLLGRTVVVRKQDAGSQ